MVIAPRQEQSLFANRDKFDLVAVYDQDSSTFTTPINILLGTISERAFRKMLRKMPMMLVGGLNEWKRKFGESEVVKGESGFPRSPRSPRSPTSTSDSPLPVSSTAMQLSTSPSHNGYLPNGNARLHSTSPLAPSFLPSTDQPPMHSPRSGSHAPLTSHSEVDQLQSRSTLVTSQPGFPIDQPQARRPLVSSTPYVGEHRPVYSVDNVHGHSRLASMHCLLFHVLTSLDHPPNRIQVHHK
jgi:ubiquitin carboxyl-terminal hydrolase 8